MLCALFNAIACFTLFRQFSAACPSGIFPLRSNAISDGVTQVSRARKGFWTWLKRITTTIKSATLQLLTSDVAYGGCYATVDKAIGTGCAGKTISFDCDGKFNTNGAGNRHYSTALLAFSLNKPVTLYADTTKKYRGYCVVTRIAVSK